MVQLGFRLLKLTVVTAVAWYDLTRQGAKILNCGQLPLPELATFVVQIVIWTALKIGAALLVLAILDYAYRRIRHERNLRMSPEEMRAELRNLQGDPRTTARRRGLWRQMATGVGKTTIDAEDVVITGDQGIAVVVRYNARTMPAPVVIANGTGRQGARFVALAARAMRRPCIGSSLPGRFMKEPTRIDPSRRAYTSR